MTSNYMSEDEIQAIKMDVRSLKDLGKRWFSVDIVTEHTADDFISRL